MQAMQQASAMEEISRNNQLPGERFCPMEDELLLCYLKPRLSGRQNVRGLNKVVFDCDLYGSQEPWEIWETYKTKRPNDLRLNKDLYFFTQHKTKSSKDKRISRNVGSGTWKGNDCAAGKPVKSLETGRKIGSKKRFTYENEASEHHGCWIMHEFYLDPSVRDKKQKANKDYVLCLLRKNGEPQAKMEKKRRQREEEEVLESNDACDDGEHSNTQQEEELLEPEAKRQRTVSAPAPVPMPSELDAFEAKLEEFLECVQDDKGPLSDAEVDAYAAKLLQDDNTPPSEAEAIGFQGVEDVGLQQLACEVQSGPCVVQLPEDDFLMNQCFEELRNFREMEEQDPAASNKDCGGSIDSQVDWLNSISFSPEDNALFSCKMPSCFLAG